MVRACGSYPQCPGFNSLHRHHSFQSRNVVFSPGSDFCLYIIRENSCLWTGSGNVAGVETALFGEEIDTSAIEMDILLFRRCNKNCKEQESRKCQTHHNSPKSRNFFRLIRGYRLQFNFVSHQPESPSEI
jgi:hypothetical protein